MSKKISEMGPKASMVDADEFTILDSADANLTTKNKRVLKSVALSGLAAQSSVDAVQSNLDAHAATNAGTAHPDGVTQTDLSNHKSAANQHPISGVTGLQTALDAKANTADLGNSASRNVGTLAGDVAAGDAPENSVNAHEGRFNHTRIPTAAQKNALDANATLSGANAVAGANDLPTSDQQDALNAANSPSGTNAFATMNDVGDGSGTFTGLTDTPGSYAGHAGKTVAVNGTENALEFVSGGGGGAVDSVTGQNSVAASPTTGAVVVNLVNDAASPGNSKYYGTSAVGARGFHDLPAGSGWQDGTTVTDWGLTVQALGSVGAGTSNVDLDSGHAITATMTADRTFNFTSTAGHTCTQWTATIDMTGGPWTPTWQFGGVAIDLPDGYDISGTFSRIEFHFIRTPTGVSVSERKIQ